MQNIKKSPTWTKVFLFIVSLSFLIWNPVSVLAQGEGEGEAGGEAYPTDWDTGGGTGFSGLVDTLIDGILNPLVILLVAVGFVIFLWGLVKYVSAGGNDEKVSEGGRLMVYGIVILFVMLSVWGFVKILETTFNLGSPAIPPPDVSGGSQQ
jgi:hypothetical protein